MHREGQERAINARFAFWSAAYSANGWIFIALS